MALHVPKLAPDARPPLGWPVEPSWYASLSGLGIMSACTVFRGVALHFFLQPTLLKELQPFSPPPPHLLFRVFDMLLLFIAGFYFIANVVLQRPMFLGDRYSGRYECLKLLLSGVVLAFMGIGGGEKIANAVVFRDEDYPPDEEKETLLVPLLPFPLPAYALFNSEHLRFFIYYACPFLLGLHFGFADGIPTLQSFGCKWSSPSRWGSCTRSEMGLGAGLVAVSVSAVVYIAMFASSFSSFSSSFISTTTDPTLLIDSVVVDQTTFSWTLRVYMTVSLLLAIPAYIYRKTHSLHIHHYLVAAILLPMTSVEEEEAKMMKEHSSGISDATSTSRSMVFLLLMIFQALLLGVFVDGIAVWGMDPIFVRNHTTTTTTITTQHQMQQPQYTLMFHQDTIQHLDVATIIWTHMIATISSSSSSSSSSLSFEASPSSPSEKLTNKKNKNDSNRWLQLLLAIEKIYSGIEKVLDDSTNIREGKRKKKKNAPDGPSPLLPLLLAEVDFHQLLKRAAQARQDIQSLTITSSSVQSNTKDADDDAYNVRTIGNRNKTNAPQNLVHDNDDDNDDAIVSRCLQCLTPTTTMGKFVADDATMKKEEEAAAEEEQEDYRMLGTTLALLQTIYLAPLAGSRELLLQCELHLSITNNTTTPKKAAPPTASPTSANAIFTYMHFNQINTSSIISFKHTKLQSEKEKHEILHSHIRHVLYRWEQALHLFLSPPSPPASSDPGGRGTHASECSSSSSDSSGSSKGALLLLRKKNKNDPLLQIAKKAYWHTLCVFGDGMVRLLRKK